MGCAEPPASFLPPRRPFLTSTAGSFFDKNGRKSGPEGKEKNWDKHGNSEGTTLTDNHTRLHPAILRVEEKVKKEQPGIIPHSRSWLHIRCQLTQLIPELVFSPLASVIARHRANRPEVSTHLVKPYTSQGWGPPKELPQASPGRSQQAGANSRCQSRLCSRSHRPPSHFSSPPCYIPSCKQALRKKKKRIPNPPQESGMSDKGHWTRGIQAVPCLPGWGWTHFQDKKSIPWDGKQSV